MKTEEHFSAGGIVYRQESGGIHVVLCGRDQPPIWALPKGTPNPGEAVEDTALREVREETGLDVAVERDAGEIEYWFHKPGARIHKRVRFYLMTPKGGNTDGHDPEFDRVAWFTPDEALKVMTYPTEADLLRRVISRVSG